MNDPIRDWAKDYGDAVGTGPDSRALTRQRARLLLAYPSPKKTGSYLKIWLSGAAVAAVCALFLMRGFGLDSSSMDQRGGEPLQVDLVGQHIQSEKTSRTIALGGGTRARLEPHSEFAVHEMTREKVVLEVATGKVDFSVKPTDHGRWVVKAGLYSVTVVGTIFSVQRDPDSAHVEVHVKRGKVLVHGEDLPASGVALRAGDQFRSANTSGDRSALRAAEDQEPVEDKQEGPEHNRSPDEADDPAAAASGRFAPTDKELRAVKDASAEKNALAKKAGSITETWQELAKEGRFEEAMASVRQTGVDGLLASAPASDALLLGNSARFSGQADIAERAFRRVRELAPGSRSSALAAYYLSRIAGDVRGDVSSSISWLRLYLKEQGNGDLAATARARLMSLLDARGDKSGARKIAREYLELHPHGAHLELARRLTQSSRP